MTPFDFDPASVAQSDIPAMLSQLAAWQSQLAARLMALPPAPENGQVPNSDTDRILTTVEAAALLRRSPKWLYRRNGSLPFARRMSERSWVYSEQGLRKWLARQRV